LKSENILLLASKLEKELNHIDDARGYVNEAREASNCSVRVWVNSIKLEYCVGNYQEARRLGDIALEKFGDKCEKLYVVISRILSKV